MKVVSRVIDPYGPYRLNGPLSIRTRSENCISLRGLKYFSPFTGMNGISRVVDPYGSYRLNGPLSIRHDRKIASHQGHNLDLTNLYIIKFFDITNDILLPGQSYSKMCNISTRFSL